MPNLNRTRFALGSGVISIALALSTIGAIAENENILIVTNAPIADRLVIDQSASGGNSANVMLDGEKSLLIGDSWMRPFASFLEPGTIRQRGKDHVLRADIRGQSNQLAVLQTGIGNSASIWSGGQANMVSVTQAGSGNQASISQSGSRNSVAIIQRQ